MHAEMDNWFLPGGSSVLLTKESISRSIRALLYLAEMSSKAVRNILKFKVIKM